MIFRFLKHGQPADIDESLPVVLKPVTVENFNDAMALRRKSPRYVGSAADVLAEGYVFREDAAVYGLYSGDTIVGLVLLSEKPRQEKYEFTDLFIADDFQRRGLGLKAVEAILQKFKSERLSKTVELQVHKTNEYAIKIYEKFGFTVTGESKWDNSFLVMSLSI